MAAKTKKNPYKGKVSICVDGRPAEELGDTYVQAVIADWLVRSMLRTRMGKPSYDFLSKWEYSGIDCEQFRKDECKNV